MSEVQNLKRLLLPLLRGLPFVIVVFAGTVVGVKRYLNYVVPLYESTAKIKLDDQTVGLSNNNLYKDFDVFSTKNKIETEAEVLRSQVLVDQVIRSIGMNVTFKRIGELKSSVIYSHRPVIVTVIALDSSFIDKPIYIEVINTARYNLYFGDPEESKPVKGFFNQVLNTEHGVYHLEVNKKLLAKRKIKLEDLYSITYHSSKKLAEEIISSRLDVKAIDKDVAILRVSLKDEVPQRASDFVNKLCLIYINDYVSTKSGAASKALQFIEGRLTEVSKRLSTDEERIRVFREDNRVINTLQETETGIKKLSELKIQLINMEMNEAALNDMDDNLHKGIFFEETAHNVGFGDLLMTEMVKKLKQYNDERNELLTKYTEQDDKVRVTDKKIEEARRFIVKAIDNARKELSIKREQIQREYDIAYHEFDNLPEIQKEYHILERDFRLNEATYNFLAEKRTEAGIASNALISFHRIIQIALPANLPVSPNRTLITFVSGLLSLLLSIGLIYAFHYFNGKIKDLEDVQKASSLSVAGVIPHRGADNMESVYNLITNLSLKGILPKNSVMAITSAFKKEGKTYLTSALSDAYANLGWKVLVIDFNLSNPGFNKGTEGLTDWFLGGNLKVEKVDKVDVVSCGTKPLSPSLVVNSDRFMQVINKLKQEYDLVIIDTPATTISMEALPILKLSSVSFFVVRSGYTKSYLLNQADLIQLEYQPANLLLVLNDAHKAINYNGMFTGTSFSYTRYVSWVDRIKNYINVYFKR